MARPFYYMDQSRTEGWSTSFLGHPFWCRLLPFPLASPERLWLAGGYHTVRSLWGCSRPEDPSSYPPTRSHPFPPACPGKETHERWNLDISLDLMLLPHAKRSAFRSHWGPLTIFVYPYFRHGFAFYKIINKCLLCFKSCILQFKFENMNLQW